MDSETEVTEIDGVGSGTADELVDEGYETVGSVAESDVDELSDVKGFGQVKAEETIEEAKLMLKGDNSGGSTEISGNLEVDGAEDVEAGPGTLEVEGDPTYGVEIDLDKQIGYHVIHVVLEEATSHHQSNNFGLRDHAYTLSEKLMIALLESGDQFEATIDVTEQELNVFYRAVSSGSLDYNSRSGITSMYGDLNLLKSEINEKRKQARAN